MRMTRRNLLAATAVAPFVPSLAGAQTRDPSWPASVTLGTASVGGTYFVYGQAWASLVGEKIGLQINTQQTQGPNQNLLLVQGKQVELGMVTMGVALQAWNGQGEWTRGQQMRDVRALFPMYDTPFHFVALRRSGITSVAQLEKLPWPDTADRMKSFDPVPARADRSQHQAVQAAPRLALQGGQLGLKATWPPHQ